MNIPIKIESDEKDILIENVQMKNVYISLK